MSEVMRIAVPVEQGDGLSAIRSEHFGHAAGFVLVDVVDGAPTSVEIVTNPPHEHGGCTITVSLLAAKGVHAVSAAGMGPGPLRGLLASGIAVYHDVESATVGEAVTAIIEDRVAQFTDDHACRGHHR